MTIARIIALLLAALFATLAGWFLIHVLTWNGTGWDAAGVVAFAGLALSCLALSWPGGRHPR